MGWNVIAFGQVECEEKYNKKVLEKLNELATPDTCILRVEDDLSFEMSGNKRVPYGSLDILGEWAVKMNIPMTISTSEYSENGNGFYFDTEEKKAEEEKDEKRMSD